MSNSTSSVRVLQIVTLLSDDGSYGGPTTVARNQCDELVRTGSAVVLASTYRGRTPASEGEGSVPLHIFKAQKIIPRSGFAGLTSLGLLWWLVRNLKSFNVVHVHLARDLVTMPAALLAMAARKPLFVQTHGMIDRSDRLLSKPLDILMTRPILRYADRVFHLTERERADLIEVGSPADSLTELRNGIRVVAEDPRRPDLIGGADADREVLFLARLAERKRPTVFVEAALIVLAQRNDVRFTLVGPDEGEAAAVEQLSAGETRLNWTGPIAPGEATRRLASAEVYVLPSVDEPYPMSVLEAMSVAVPVIVTDTCGLAADVTSAECGIVVSDDVAGLVTAIEHLLDNPAEARSMGERGRRHVETHLGMSAVGSSLSFSYTEAIDQRTGAVA